ELDYGQEASHAERFIKNFSGNANVRFPHVYRQASGKKVLCSELFLGHRLDEAIAAGYSGEQIAKNSVDIIAQMIFIDGFFHADPHPGNLRILGTPEAPVIGMLDLGLVGHLPVELREKATTLMIAVVRNDIDDLCDALLDIGRPRGKVDR